MNIRLVPLGLLALLVASAASLPLVAQSPIPELSDVPPEPNTGESIADYRGRLVDHYKNSAQQVATSAQRATEEVAEAVAKQTTAVAAPEGFAERVNESISDFLPLFQFAVNSVSTSEDKKSVTVKANTIQLGRAVLAVSGTAAEPEVFTQIANLIDEPVRDSQRTALLKGVSDFSDLTAAAELGIQSRVAESWSASRKLFGREAATYQKLIGEYLSAVWASVKDDTKIQASQAGARAEKLEAPLLKISSRVQGLTFEKIRAAIADGTLKDFDERSYRQALAEQARVEAALRLAVSAASISNLPTLVDNQPQLVFRYAERSVDDIVGPDSTVLSVNYEMGFHNFNSVLREYRKHRLVGGLDDENAKVEALKSVASGWGFGSEDKIIFGLTFKDVDKYQFRHPYKLRVIDSANPNGIELDRVAEVSLDASRELRGKVTWTRLVPGFRGREGSASLVLPNPQDPDFLDKAIPKEQGPRLTITIEGVDFQDDTLRQDQLIGKVSYVMPLMGGVTLPVSIVYANRKEFVGEQDHMFGAHVGVSYKFTRTGN